MRLIPSSPRKKTRKVTTTVKKRPRAASPRPRPRPRPLQKSPKQNKAIPRGGAGVRYNEIDNSFPSLAPQVLNTVTGRINVTPQTNHRITLINSEFEKKRLYITRSDDSRISMVGYGTGGYGVQAIAKLPPTQKFFHVTLSTRPNIEGFVFLRLTDLLDVHTFLKDAQLQIRSNANSYGTLNHVRSHLLTLVDEAVTY